MRVIGQSLAALVGAFVVVSLVGGQQPGGGFGKGGFGGGFGGAALQQDPVALLRLDQVKKELNVTDEQSDKIPEAVMKGLAAFLTTSKCRGYGKSNCNSRRTMPILIPMCKKN